MIIETLELKDFRNIPELRLELDRGVNIFYGRNAQGKTNILEALFAGITSKSHRTSKDREMIRFHQDSAHIKILLKKRDLPYRIDMHIKKNKAKGIAVNGVAIRRVSDLFGIGNLIFFAPEDLGLVKNGPADRRRFMDLELCQLDKVYLHDLISYNRLIDQKSRLLKQMQEKKNTDTQETQMLSVYNEQLISYAQPVIEGRDRFLRQLSEILKDTHRKLTEGSEELTLIYEPNVRLEEMEEALLTNQKREIRTGTCLVGPHRDDFEFRVNHTDLRRYGSQGQQRTAALSVKLAEIELVRDLTGDDPVLLLDDVLSELDRGRQELLLGSIHDIQTLITCTGVDDLLKRQLHVNRIFLVKDGNAEVLSNTGENQCQKKEQ